MSNTDSNVDSTAKVLEGRVWELFGQKNVKQAITACEQLNRQYPDFASGWHTTSQLALKLDNRPMALAAIEKAVAIEPDNTTWLLQKATCMLKLGQINRVDDLVTQLAEREMVTTYECSTLGMLLTRMDRREEAVRQYEKAITLEPDDARHYYNLACLQRTLGQTEAAEENFDKTINLNPADFEAYKIRSELRKQTSDRNHVESMEALLHKGIEDKRGMVNVCYALAKELEDLGESERSFHYLKEGADCRRSYMQYDVERDVATMTSIRETFSAKLFDGSKEGDPNSEAIFVLGMPRTGTTLVERILSSHSQVYAAGELNNFAVQMMSLVKSQEGHEEASRDDLVQLTTKLDFKNLGEAYINSTRPLAGHTQRFIDKLPFNYLYVGLIHLALPNAKIINLQRDPLDTCYAVYKQLFVDAYPFSYDLEELARYYVSYHRLMDHWRSVLPGVVHTIEYEKLVNDLEGESRKLLQFCCLDWEPQCLKFYESTEASTTASTVQVRQPVYKSSVGLWRKYEKQMQPVVNILKEAGIHE